MNNHPLHIKNALLHCSYNQKIQYELAQYIQKNYNNKEDHQFFLFSDIERKLKFFLMKTKLKLNYISHNKTVIINIYFIKDFPMKPPEIYLDKQPNNSINPICAFYIDKETFKLNYEMFFQWKNNINDLSELLSLISKQFILNYPIVFDAKDGLETKSKNNYLIPITLTDYNHYNESINHISRATTLKQINHHRHSNSSLDNYSNNNIQKKRTFNDYYNHFGGYTNDFADNIINQSRCSTTSVSKNDIIDHLISKIKHKISKKTKENYSTYLLIEKSKQAINGFKENINQILDKEQTFNETVNTLTTELNTTYDFSLFTKKQNDYSNLDTIIDITNKKLLLHTAHIDSIENYLIILKKAFEYDKIQLSTAIKEYQLSTKRIFFHKYQQSQDMLH